MEIGGAEITSNVARPKAFSAPGVLRGALMALADLLLPPVCIACRKRAGAHGLLCGDSGPRSTSSLLRFARG